MLDITLKTIWTQLNTANLHGIPLLIAMLMCFFAGVTFTVRRLRMDARAFWTLVLRGTQPKPVRVAQAEQGATPATDHQE